jgi:hypothetical protein
LEPLFCFVQPDALRAQAAQEGLIMEDEFRVPLKQEKAFHVLHLRKPAAGPAITADGLPSSLPPK